MMSINSASVVRRRVLYLVSSSTVVTEKPEEVEIQVLIRLLNSFCFQKLFISNPNNELKTSFRDVFA